MLWLCLLFILAACTSTGGDDLLLHSSRAQQPDAQQGSGKSTRARAKSHADLGAGYYEARQFSTALDEARIAIAADSSYAPAHNLLALVYMELKEHRAASDAFERALKLEPGDPEISNNYGWFLCQIGQEPKGLEYLQAAVRNPLYAAPAVALTNAAACAQNIKNFDRAGEYLAQALRVDPNNPRALFMLAELNHKLGRYGEAQLRIAAFHRLVEASAESTWLALRIARGQGNRGDEARFGAQLRQKFSTSNEFQKMLQGQYE
ncbi:type IV pilus biogenesis/stability protein PilW [Denitratisoma oestradiolicum]|nr:type IV pilus biogenesis/stability protein PilW [Denitratisoma oestradiolicum]TWO78999.1 type IV pilus biogenesis/stability protein PilW [Denitratisoma oestradiolicum]